MKSLNRWLTILGLVFVALVTGQRAWAEGLGQPVSQISGVPVTFVDDVTNPIKANLDPETLVFRLSPHETNSNVQWNGQSLDNAPLTKVESWRPNSKMLAAGDVVTYTNTSNQIVRVEAQEEIRAFRFDNNKNAPFWIGTGYRSWGEKAVRVSVDGETKPMYVSFTDLDYGDRIGIRKDQISMLLFKTENDLTFTEENGYLYFNGYQGSKGTNPTEQKVWVSILLKSSSVDLRYNTGTETIIGIENTRLASAIIPTTDFTARKIWSGGPADKPTVRFVLQQNGVDYTGSDAIKELPNGTTEVTWTDLPKQDANKVDYVYTVREEAVPNYTTSYNADTTEVTNTYVPPKTTFTAIKVWVNGPAVKPSINLQLLQNGVAYGTPVTLSNGTISHTWTDLPEKDAAGAAYVYTVDEVDTPTNYRKSIAGSTITNTYVAPRTSYTAKKVWVGGTASHPDIQFQLYRDGVAHGVPVTLTNDTLEYTWTDLAETDEAGNVYTYTVDEVDVPVNYTKVVNGNTVTNTYVSPKTAYTAKKVWVGGASTRPDIQFQLYRNGVAYDTPVTLTSGTTEYTWTDLDEKDENGIAYDYTVDEVDVPVNYIKSVAGNTITNTYVSPKTAYTATKVWVGGPSPRPAIQLQLFQNGTAYGAPVDLMDGTTEYTWTDLEETDENGIAYTYSVDEVEVPDNYSKVVQGNILTNTYQTRDVKVTKVWKGDEASPTTRPTEIVVVLLKNGRETGQTLKLTAENDWTGNFLNLPKTENGNEIVYTVKEVAVEDYTSQISGDQDAGFVITNTFVPKPLPSTTPPSSTPKAKLPKTGSSNSLVYIWIGFAVVGLAFVWKKSRI